MVETLGLLGRTPFFVVEMSPCCEHPPGGISLPARAAPFARVQVLPPSSDISMSALILIQITHRRFRSTSARKATETPPRWTSWVTKWGTRLRYSRVFRREGLRDRSAHSRHPTHLFFPLSNPRSARRQRSFAGSTAAFCQQSIPMFFHHSWESLQMLGCRIVIIDTTDSQTKHKAIVEAQYGPRSSTQSLIFTPPSDHLKHL